MGYCTQTNLVGRYGEREILNLSDKGSGTENPHSDTIDSARVQLAIDDATAEIDMYLSKCYSISAIRNLYLASKTVPRLVTMACEIARYKLYDTQKVEDTNSDSEVYRRYKNTVRDLQNICDGNLLDSDGNVIDRPCVDGMRISVAKKCNIVPNLGCNSSHLCRSDEGLE